MGILRRREIRARDPIDAIFLKWLNGSHGKSGIRLSRGVHDPWFLGSILLWIAFTPIVRAVTPV